MVNSPRLWKYVDGRRKKDAVYSSPSQLWKACVSYFEWVTENPLKEEQVFSNGSRMTVNRPRAMTLEGLCIHLGISRKTWQNWRNRYTESGDISRLIEVVDNIIYSQKFEYAAVGMMNSSLISRDLGLADRSEITGRDGRAIQTETTFDLATMTDEELAAVQVLSAAARRNQSGD